MGWFAFLASAKRVICRVRERGEARRLEVCRHALVAEERDDVCGEARLVRKKCRDLLWGREKKVAEAEDEEGWKGPRLLPEAARARELA